jgi:hypothetical protein
LCTCSWQCNSVKKKWCLACKKTLGSIPSTGKRKKGRKKKKEGRERRREGGRKEGREGRREKNAAFYVNVIV